MNHKWNYISPFIAICVNCGAEKRQEAIHKRRYYLNDRKYMKAPKCEKPKNPNQQTLF